MVVFLVIVAVVLACVVFVNVQACLFYLSAYARATKRGFLDTMRDAHAREVYALSRRLAPRVGKAKDGSEGVRVFFDVAIPRADARAVMADVVLVSADGIAVLCVQEGRGTLYGSVDDAHWLLVGSRSGENTECMVPNLGVQAAQAALALREYLLLKDDCPCIASAVVLGFLVKGSGVDVPSGVTLTSMKDVSKVIRGALGDGAKGPESTEGASDAELSESAEVSSDMQPSEDVESSSSEQFSEENPLEAEAPEDAEGISSAKPADELKESANTQDDSGAQASDDVSKDESSAATSFLSWDAATRKRVCRMIKACANAEIDKADTGGNPSGKDGSSGGILRSIVQRGREESAVADLVRKADRLAASKEDFDALTWERILEIGAELEGGVQAERTAELAAELRLIARTNVSLNYRFGIAQPSAGAKLSPAGLVMESSAKDLASTLPDPDIHEAIEQSTFFDDSDEGDKARTAEAHAPSVGCVSEAHVSSESSNKSDFSEEDSKHTQVVEPDNFSSGEATEDAKK